MNKNVYNSELDWYFRSGPSEWMRSSFGAVLRRQESRRYDSTGAPIEYVEARSWVYQHLKPDTSYEPSYTPDHDTSMRAALISRRLRMLTPIWRTALEFYYGDAGKHWQSILDGDFWFACVGHLTDAGRAIIHGSEISNPQRALESELRDHRAEPTEWRSALIKVMGRKSRELLMGAHKEYERLS